MNSKLRLKVNVIFQNNKNTKNNTGRREE